MELHRGVRLGVVAQTGPPDRYVVLLVKTFRHGLRLFSALRPRRDTSVDYSTVVFDFWSVASLGRF